MPSMREALTRIAVICKMSVDGVAKPDESVRRIVDEIKPFFDDEIFVSVRTGRVDDPECLQDGLN